MTDKPVVYTAVKDLELDQPVPMLLHVSALITFAEWGRYDLLLALQATLEQTLCVTPASMKSFREKLSYYGNLKRGSKTRQLVLSLEIDPVDVRGVPEDELRKEYPGLPARRHRLNRHVTEILTLTRYPLWPGKHKDYERAIVVTDDPRFAKVLNVLGVPTISTIGLLEIARSRHIIDLAEQVSLLDTRRSFERKGKPSKPAKADRPSSDTPKQAKGQ